ncbi:MAG TPA: hypothetical protein GXX33_01375 [Firmicutes bacterium]|nr:hypothetical protein [Bacillota bacterium]
MEEKQGMVETEKQVDALLAEADRFLTTAEQTQDPTGVYENCRAAVGNLLLAYLLARGEVESPSADCTIKQLWAICIARDSEVLLLAENIGLFLDEAGSVATAEEAETILDTANEIWDFIFDSFPE